MTASNDSDSQASHHYQLLKLAANQYQTGPENLDQTIKTKLESQADVAQAIIAAVLASPEAKQERVLEQEVDFVIQALEQQFEDIATFNNCLELQGLSIEHLRQAIYQDLLSEKILNAQGKGPEVTEAEALNYYQQHTEQFSRPELRKVSHILVTINDEYPENRRPAATAKIEGLRQELLNDMSIFVDMALKHSECPTSLNEGLIGEVKPGQLYPELDEELFKMEANSISSVVETETGLHLLYCHSITPPYKQSESEAVQLLLKQMNEHREKQRQKQWLKSVMTASVTSTIH